MDVDAELWPEGSTLLHIVANSEDTKTLRLLLKSDRASIDEQDSHCRSPLSLALQNGRLSSARILIEYGASLDLPLYSGSHDGAPSTIAQALSSSGAFRDFVERLTEDKLLLPLDLGFLLPTAASEGKTELVRSLLFFYKVGPNARDELCRTALHYASQRGNIPMVRMLAKAGADRFLGDWRGSTPLHLTCTTGNTDVSKVLLEEVSTTTQASLLNVVDALGNTPLHIALLGGHFCLFGALMNICRSELDLTLTNRDGHTVKTLLLSMRLSMNSKITPDLQVLPCLTTEEATFILYEGVSQKDIAMMKYGIFHGADVNAFDFMQQTPLLLSTKLGQLDACRLLVAHGANVNALDFAGKSALQYACELHYLEVVSFLLSTSLINPRWMFSRFNYPLSSDLIHALVAYFDSVPYAAKPKSWLRWLALAAPLASASAFCSLATSICPASWVTQLLERDVSKIDSLEHERSPPGAAYCKGASFLPYLQLLPNEELPCFPVDDNSEETSRRATCFATLKTPPAPSEQWKFVVLKTSKPILKRGKKRFSRKIIPHYITPRPDIIHHKYYPLHEAALHENLDVVDFILYSVSDPELHAELLTVLLDDQGRTVLELLARSPAMLAAVKQYKPSRWCGSTEEKLLLPHLADNFLEKLFTLPDEVSFEQALITYCLVGKYVCQQTYQST